MLFSLSEPLSPFLGSAFYFSPPCVCFFFSSIFLPVSSPVSVSGSRSRARSQRNEPGSDRFGCGRKSSLMWLWWMCGTEMCNLPVGVIADNALMSFPKAWRISECTLTTRAQIHARLSLQVFLSLFISLKISNKECVGLTKLCRNQLFTLQHTLCPHAGRKWRSVRSYWERAAQRIPAEEPFIFTKCICFWRSDKKKFSQRTHIRWIIMGKALREGSDTAQQRGLYTPSVCVEVRQVVSRAGRPSHWSDNM